MPLRDAQLFKGRFQTVWYLHCFRASRVKNDRVSHVAGVFNSKQESVPDAVQHKKDRGAYSVSSKRNKGSRLCRGRATFPAASFPDKEFARWWARLGLNQ